MLRRLTHLLFSTIFVVILCSSVMGYPLLSMPDLPSFSSHWLDSNSIGTNGWQAWDTNQDGIINFEDFAFLLQDSNTAFTDTDIASGQFQMGDSNGSPDEMPVHPVYITQFAMSKFSVTNQQYVDFLDWAITYHQITVIKGVVYGFGTAGASFPYCDTHDSNSLSQIDYLLTTGSPTGSDMIINAFEVRTKAGRSMANDPMVMVSWYGATAYCNWLSQQRGIQPCYDTNSTCIFTKGSYRLPTEAEWQFAAYGGQHFRFPFGDIISHYKANYFSEPNLFTYDLGPTWGYNPAFDDGVFPYTAPVWSFKPNGYGLYNMAGNVSQWCNDWYCTACAIPLVATNPTGPATGMFRVIHGGGWDDTAERCIITARGFGSPASRYGDVGFRIVWNPFLIPLN